MAKVAIKSEKLTPFGGILSIMEQFDSRLSSVIDSTLGLRCKQYGYQYSEIIRSLMSVYFCGGSSIEDITTHLMSHLSLHPTLRTCSADTILRAIKELTQDNISYTSDTGKTYDFNTADKLNTLLLNCLLSTGQLKEGEGYDVDFDHQFIEAEKYDAKPTYKKFLGYRPGVAVIGDLIVGIENRRTKQEQRQNLLWLCLARRRKPKGQPTNEARAETKLALAMPCEEKEAQRATATATQMSVSTRRTR